MKEGQWNRQSKYNTTVQSQYVHFIFVHEKCSHPETAQTFWSEPTSNYYGHCWSSFNLHEQHFAKQCLKQVSGSYLPITKILKANSKLSTLLNTLLLSLFTEFFFCPSKHKNINIWILGSKYSFCHFNKIIKDI